MSSSKEIILKFGGVRPLARILGVWPSTVQYWWENEIIPIKRRQEIYDAAVAQGIKIKPKDFYSDIIA